MNQSFDVIIIGAGPSGCASAISLRDAGLKVALLDKSIFPREKTCGDGLTLDVMKQLSLMSDDLAEAFRKLEPKKIIYGIKVYSADNKSISIPILQQNEKRCMYTVRRIDFDNMLLQFIKQKTNISVFEDCCLKNIQLKEGCVAVSTSKGYFKCAIVVGADGANSIVAKNLRPLKISDNDKAMALRNYYEGVSLENEGHFIEFYSNIKLLPGGLWVFPVGNNIVNVGLGMQISLLKKKKVNLKKILDEEIRSGVLKESFKNAKPIDRLQGHIIPLGKKERPISGERFVLAGDAAGLAFALSGEGIGSALRSGRVAAQHIKSCFKQNNFSKTYNLKYDKEIYYRMGREFSNYRLLQYLFRFPLVVNFLIGKVAPYFIDIFNEPEYLARFQGKKFFILRLIKHIIFHKKTPVIKKF